jgi:hypothetical protein
MTQNFLPLALIGALVLGTAALIVVAHANSGEHVRLAGNVWEIPTGDQAHAMRHAWRPGAGGDTVRVSDLVRRLADEAALPAPYGRHALIDYPPAGDEDQAEQLHAPELIAA